MSALRASAQGLRTRKADTPLPASKQFEKNVILVSNDFEVITQAQDDENTSSGAKKYYYY